ncbi:MAG: pilus assembly protein PilM [Phycisphaerae bacterium]
MKKRRKPGPIGLDIGTTGVRLLQLIDAGHAPAIIAAEHCEWPDGAIEAGDRAAAAEPLIAESLRRHPFIGRRVVTALGADEFQIKNIRLPCMPEKDLAQAVEFEARDRFEFPDGTAQFRSLAAGEVRHGNEMKTEVIVFGTQQDVIRQRLRMLDALKVQPLAIDLSPCAVARCFIRFLRRAEDADAMNVFLNVGWRGTMLVITRGSELAFVKFIEVGGRHFTSRVADVLGVSKEEAAHVRIRIMRQSGGRRATDTASVADDLRDTVSDAIRPAVERLAREIHLCLRYFAVTFRGQRPECLTFVGGDAHEPQLMKVLEAGIDIPCTIGNPLRGVGGIERIGGPDRRTLQPAWSVVAGLALRGSRWVEPAAGRAGGGPMVTPMSAAVG